MDYSKKLLAHKSEKLRDNGKRIILELYK